MDARFTVLASGSSGNASLIEVDGFGLLIDCGLPPRTLGYRLAAIGSSWERIHAVILTHIHGDHWKDTTLARLRTQRIPFIAHQAHLDELNTSSSAFQSMHQAKLTQAYRTREAITLGPRLVCKPIMVPHDAEPTFAFRIEANDGSDTPAWSVAYASDLGHSPTGLAESFAGSDVLAVEFNHDVPMQKTSGRPAHLIQRVLGKRGHLSNHQAAELTSEVIQHSGDSHPGVVVQLHLSRQCNTPELAVEAGKQAIAATGRAVTIVTAKQDVPARSIPLTRRVHTPCRLTRSTVIASAQASLGRVHYQPPLPGFGV